MTSGRLLAVAKVLAELFGTEVTRTVRPDEHAPGRPRAIRLALERLGPFYVKVGQMLSTRPDLVSPQTRAELALLHDRVSSVPFAMFEPVLAEDLGADWERRFEHIDRSRPLGSASLAQAYRAVLRGGEPAVLKIQRPDIRSQVLADMALMRRAARLVARAFPDFNADPHPGNIFVAPGHKAHLIDWGMVGRIDRRMSMTLVTVLLNLAHNDGPGMARAWVELGRATPWADIPGFAGDMALLAPKIATASLEDLDFGVTLTSVLKYSTRRGIQTSPVVSLLGKSFSNIEGSVRHLTPELALTDVFEEQLRDILLHLAGESLSETQAARTAMDLMIGSTLAPEQLRGLARDAANRDFTVRVGRLRDARAAGPAPSTAALQTAAVIAALLWWTRRHRCAPPDGR